jgi:hypothetical protein
MLFHFTIVLTFLLLALCLSTAHAQEVIQSATSVSADSVYAFSMSHSKQRRVRNEKMYYSFVNFKITKQAGARAWAYLHGPFENRSYTTNMLYARGTFRKGLKHGEWRTWNVDGTLNTIERWKKGRLRRREYTVEQNFSAIHSTPNKEDGVDHESGSSRGTKDKTLKSDKVKTKRLFSRWRKR